MSNADHEERKQRVWNFYKKVLKWHKGQGSEHKACREAAIGLPVAMKSDKGQEHVRKFLLNALKNGTPPEVLLQLAYELEQEKKREAK